MSFGDFVNNTNSLANSIGNLVGETSQLVEVVNDFELPTVKTQHNFGVSAGSIITIGAVVAGLILGSKWIFGNKKKKRR